MALAGGASSSAAGGASAGPPVTTWLLTFLVAAALIRPSSQESAGATLANAFRRVLLNVAGEERRSVASASHSHGILCYTCTSRNLAEVGALLADVERRRAAYLLRQRQFDAEEEAVRRRMGRLRTSRSKKARRGLVLPRRSRFPDDYDPSSMIAPIMPRARPVVYSQTGHEWRMPIRGFPPASTPIISSTSPLSSTPTTTTTTTTGTNMGGSTTPVEHPTLRPTIGLPRERGDAVLSELFRIEAPASIDCEEPFAANPDFLEQCSSPCIKVVSENKYVQVVVRGCLSTIYRTIQPLHDFGAWNSSGTTAALADALAGGRGCAVQEWRSASLGRVAVETCLCESDECNGAGQRTLAAALMSLLAAAWAMTMMGSRL